MGQSNSHINPRAQDQPTPSTPSNTGTPYAFGLLELAQGDNPVVDIVALHGLDGHRESSWTADNGVLWLRDLLVAKIPHARIVSYGYDVNTRGQGQLSTASLHTHAINLIAHLAAKRKSTSTEQRPIIFIAHSLGGLLLKDALIYAHSCGKNNLPLYKAVEVSTSGILFFGTPHQGSKGANLLTIVLTILSAFGKGTTKIIKNIRNNSGALEKQLSQYQAISANYDTKFYFETYKTPIGPFTKSLLVPRTSAVVPGAINAEAIPLNKDHVNMVKFETAADGTFQLVSSHLLTMVEEGPQRISERWKARNISKAVALERGTIMEMDPVLEASDDSNGTKPRIDPAPLPMLPYLEAGDSFVGRRDVLHWIHETFKKRHKIALYGIGGIGKTGIAVQYVYNHRLDYDIIFWVNGDTLETTTSGFISIAQQLVHWKSRGTPASSSNSGRDYTWVALELGLDNHLDSIGQVSRKIEHREDIIRLVKEWMSQAKNGNWLMVFDNVDDLDSFELTTFFPTPLMGRIIITSRKQESRYIGAGSCRGEADDDAHQIVQMLEGLPLAIELAGAYIAALQLSFQSYATTMHEPWKHIFTETIRPYGRSLVAAWEISFRAIEARSLLAANLLLIGAFLGSEDIPEVLFQKKLGVGMVNEALKQLFAFSLAKRGPSETSFSIHPLVHAWARERLNEDQKAEKVKEMVVLLGDIISQMPLSWNHTFIGANYALKYCLPRLHGNSEILICDSLEKIAEREKGILLQGMFRMALEATEDVEGPDAVQTFTAMELLGSSYFGDMDRPVSQFLRHALRERERHSNTDLPVNSSRLMLAKRCTLGEAGKLGHGQAEPGYNTAKRHTTILEPRMEGERLVRCALEGREKVQGLGHIDTLRTVQVLAGLIWNQRRFDEAEELDRRALQGREQILGLEHADTLEVLYNLAMSMHDQGGFAEAETLHRRALEGREKLLGLNHADTFKSIHELGVLMYGQGRFDEAETFDRRALEGREKLLGFDHADTFKSVHELAVLIHAQGRFGEAEKLKRRALKGREKLLGLSHADTLTSVHELALSIHEQGRFTEAEVLKRRALEGREKVLGLNHVDTLTSVHELAVSIHEQGRFTEAELLKRRALEGRENLLGTNHADTLFTVEQLAVTVYAQGWFSEAEALYRRALEGREILLGFNHTDTIFSVQELAASIHAQGRFEEAKKLEQRVAQGKMEVL